MVAICCSASQRERATESVPPRACHLERSAPPFAAGAGCGWCSGAVIEQQAPARHAECTRDASRVHALLVHAAWLERDERSRSVMGLSPAATLSLWCLAYEIGPGAGYFVVISDLASGVLGATVYACGNAARFASEFVLSFAFLSTCGHLGLTTVLLFHAAIAATLALLLSVALRETNPLHAGPPAGAATLY